MQTRRSPHGASAGFHTGPLGFGHAALIADDMAAMERFYVDALGFAVTERLRTKAGPLEIEGAFLHCNRRHHSLALFDMPLRKRLHHFMLQTNRLADVGGAFEQIRRDRVPVSLGLGQHPDPDGTFSFYAATPSGFDFEIGWGAAEIDPGEWLAQHTSVASAWGHQPTPRLRLRIAGAMLRRWAGRAVDSSITAVKTVVHGARFADSPVVPARRFD